MATGWSPKDYTPFFLYLDQNPMHSPKEIRAEYTRQRDIAMKRANRLAAAGLDAQAAYLREMFPKLAEIGQNNQQVAMRLSHGHAILGEYSYSLQGIKKLQSLINEETGEIVPLGDVLSFNDYMKSWRLSAFKMTIISDFAVNLYGEEYQDIGGTFSDFYTLYQQM